jgi:hypothetical protein
MFLGFDRKGDQRCWFKRVLFDDHLHLILVADLNDKSSFLAPRLMKRPAAARVALKFSRTVRLPSGAAVRWSALVRDPNSHPFSQSNTS